jgi:Cu2+-exporting ATPase
MTTVATARADPMARIRATVDSAIDAAFDPASDVAVDTACFHCSLPVADARRWTVAIAGAPQPMCCPGCAAVAQAIVDNGLDDYYRTRSGVSPTAARASLVPPELLLYDAPEIIAGFATPQGDAGEDYEATLSVGGIRCGACVWLVERRLAAIPGVQSAALNVATEKLIVRWQPALCRPSDFLGALRELGYDAWPFDAARHDAQQRLRGRQLLRQLFVAGLCMMQVMMYAFPAYIATDGTMEAGMRDLMRWASLVLTLPAVGYSALPFFRGALRDLRNRLPGMDVPVSLGILAAFAGSVVATVRGSGEVYFDSVTMFIFLLLASRTLELQARRKAASALERLRHTLPAAASRLPDFPAARSAATVPALQLVAGDFILVKPGEAVPADCTIVEGATDIDAALLSGESRAQWRITGDVVPGGAINLSQAIVARVLRPVRESTLSALIGLAERAAQDKPRLSLWADRAAACFVAALLVLTVAVFAFWQWHEPSRAWQIAISLLVVSCPCALSLATPAALAAATARLVQRGVLVVQPHVLETLHRCTHVVFDKTGTLTAGKPVLDHTERLSDLPAHRCLQIAAALEAGNDHPLAAAIVKAAAAIGEPGSDTLSEVVHSAGCGMQGVAGGVRYRLGSAAFVSAIAGDCPDRHATPVTTPVYLGTAGRWLARFDFSDRLRDDARDVVAYFKAHGKTVILLSGDHESVVRQVAVEVGIGIGNGNVIGNGNGNVIGNDSDLAHGQQLPDQKLAFVRRLQRDGAVVMMVGDGINDAAALQAADVSFAMGAGAAVAHAHADAVLLADRLSLVVEAADTARRTMTVIRQNLAWALLYNAAAIPAAAFGLLNPWMSGIGMSVSSAVVVLNALRLRRTASMHLHT